MFAKMEVFNGGGIIRVFDDGQRLGDPYNYSIAFRFKEGMEVEFVGVNKVPSLVQARAIMQCLRRNGLKKSKRLRGKDFYDN